MKGKNILHPPRACSPAAPHVPLFVRTCMMLLCLACTLLLSLSYYRLAEAGEQPEPSDGASPASVKLKVNTDDWRQLASGLDVLELKVRRNYQNDEPVLEVSAAEKTEKADMIIVRSDPKRFEYTLHMASEDGQHLSLLERARRHGLVAAINAGMYLPDKLKNTGYMRSDAHINNSRIVANFGAFFVAGARKKSLPQADLLEKNELGSAPQNRLDDYGLVIQNYRLISQNGRILWPDNQSTYSISALGKDKNGNILFISCEYPLSAPDFSRILLCLPIDNKLAMYLEGGSQAGLVLRDDEDGRESFRVWRGRHGGLAGLSRPDNVPLPNVLGLKPKK